MRRQKLRKCHDHTRHIPVSYTHLDVYKRQVQKGIVQLNSEQQEKLTKKLSEQKIKQEELKGKIDAAKEAYAKSTEETGKNSEQSKALKAVSYTHLQRTFRPHQ